MDVKLRTYEKWFHSEMENIKDKISQSKRRNQLSESTYFRGMLAGMQFCSDKLTDINLRKKLKQEIILKEEDIAKAQSGKNDDMTQHLEGMTDALVRCLEKLED